MYNSLSFCIHRSFATCTWKTSEPVDIPINNFNEHDGFISTILQILNVIPEMSIIVSFNAF